MVSEKKDVMFVKKKKRKDKKDKKKKKKKTTKKKTQERGITVNINLARAIGEAKAKAPKTARGFAPKVASIRGQRSRGGGELNTRQAEINTNLMNNVYAIRAQADKQQQQFGEELKGLSTNLGILQAQVTQLGTQAMNPPQQPININVPPAPAPAPLALPAPAPAPPALPAPPQPSEEEQQYRRNMGRAISNMVENQRQLNQQQQGLYQGVQLLVDSQHGIHNRLAGIEEAGRQMAGNQGTLMALESIYNEGFEESNVEPQQPPAPPPLPPPPPPPMETIPEEDPARMSSSVDPQEEEKADLMIEDVKTADESVIKQDKKMRGPVKGTARIAFTTEQLSTILDLAGDAVGKNNKGMTEFFKKRQDYKDLVKEYQGNESSIKNKITQLKKALEQQE